MSPQKIREELERRKRHVEDDYLQYLDDSIPIQRCAKVVARLLLARLAPMFFERYIKPDLSDCELKLKKL